MVHEAAFLIREENMNIIAAVDRNWAIGKNNSLLVSIPADMKFFRQTTTGKVVVMGRKTLESFPNGLPLKNRTNIVLSSREDYSVKDAVIVHSMEELSAELEKYDTDDIYVIGGESIYRQLLPVCSTAHITKIDHEYEADAWFPNLDEDPEWHITADSDEQTYFDLEYRFLKYERVQ
jgi:dihydrofolate reductase